MNLNTTGRFKMELTYREVAAIIMDEVHLRESRHIMDCEYCKKHAKMLAKIYYEEAEGQGELFTKDEKERGE